MGMALLPRKAASREIRDFGGRAEGHAGGRLGVGCCGRRMRARWLARLEGLDRDGHHRSRVASVLLVEGLEQTGPPGKHIRMGDS